MELKWVEYNKLNWDGKPLIEPYGIEIEETGTLIYNSIGPLIEPYGIEIYWRGKITTLFWTNL